MCECCVVDAINYGEVVPDVWLVRARKIGSFMQKGDWGLLFHNDPSVVWSFVPEPDPTFGMTDKQEAEFIRKSPKRKQYWEQTRRMHDLWDRLRLLPHEGYVLYKGMLKKGYDAKKHGHVGCWLFHHLGLLVKKNPNGVREHARKRTH